MDLMYTAQLLGNLGEFLAAIAVLVTLWILIAQVRDTKRLLIESASTYRFTTGREMTFKSMELAPLYSKMAKHMIGDSWEVSREAESLGLATEELLQLRSFAAFSITNHERNYRSPIPEFEREQLLKNAAWQISIDPVYRAQWETYFKNVLPNDFVEAVEEEASRSDTSV